MRPDKQLQAWLILRYMQGNAFLGYPTLYQTLNAHHVGSTPLNSAFILPAGGIPTATPTREALKKAPYAIIDVHVTTAEGAAAFDQKVIEELVTTIGTSIPEAITVAQDNAWRPRNLNRTKCAKQFFTPWRRPPTPLPPSWRTLSYRYGRIPHGTRHRSEAVRTWQPSFTCPRGICALFPQTCNRTSTQTPSHRPASRWNSSLSLTRRIGSYS